MKYKIFSSVNMSELESEINSLARRKEIVSVQFLLHRVCINLYRKQGFTITIAPL